MNIDFEIGQEIYLTEGTEIFQGKIKLIIAEGEDINIVTYKGTRVNKTHAFKTLESAKANVIEKLAERINAVSRIKEIS